jgi:Mce-associated membrane protein
MRSAILAIVVLLVAGTALQVADRKAAAHPAAANRALTDDPATAVVIADVSNALAKIFSYTPDGTRETEQAAAQLLGGTAASQYTTLFGQVKAQAAKQGLTLTTRVVRAGVVRLTADTAQLLVFLDQTTVRKDRREPANAAAQLAVTAKRSGEDWRIMEIHAR